MQIEDAKVAILVADLFQDAELIYPYYRLVEEGADVRLVGADVEGTVTGKYGYSFDVRTTAERATTEDFDAVVIPGGWAPDAIRRSEAALSIVRNAMARGRVVAGICHAGWVLCSADVVDGREATSYIAIKDDMVNAGADWRDAEVVVDENLITSRTPDDLPAFCRAIIGALKEI